MCRSFHSISTSFFNYVRLEEKIKSVQEGRKASRHWSIFSQNQMAPARCTLWMWIWTAKKKKKGCHTEGENIWTQSFAEGWYMEKWLPVRQKEHDKVISISGFHHTPATRSWSLPGLNRTDGISLAARQLSLQPSPHPTPAPDNSVTKGASAACSATPLSSTLDQHFGSQGI